MICRMQGRLRSGSMPPPSPRASSQPPGARSGSVAPPAGRPASPTGLIHHAGPGGIIRHRSATTTVVRGVRGDGSTGVVAGQPRSTHAVAGHPQRRRRASISVVPSSSAPAAASTASVRRSTNDHQPIVRGRLPFPSFVYLIALISSNGGFRNFKVGDTLAPPYFIAYAHTELGIYYAFYTGKGD